MSSCVCPVVEYMKFVHMQPAGHTTSFGLQLVGSTRTDVILPSLFTASADPTRPQYYSFFMPH